MGGRGWRWERVGRGEGGRRGCIISGGVIGRYFCKESVALWDRGPPFFRTLCLSGSLEKYLTIQLHRARRLPVPVPS